MIENKKEKYKTILIMVLIGTILLGASFLYEKVWSHKEYDQNVLNSNMTFDLKITEHSDHYVVEIKAQNYLIPNFDILYTVNDLFDDLDQGIEYTEPFVIAKEEFVKPISISVKIVRDGTIICENVETFFSNGIEENANYRYNSYVVNILVDENDLYDETNGILVEGPNYTGQVHTANYHQRGDEWDRDIYFQLFDKSLSPLVSDIAKIGVQGRGSSAFDVKSLKVSTIDELDQKISLDLNPYHNQYSSFQTINKQEKIVLSAGGNDFPIVMNVVRYSAIKEFARLEDMMVAETAVVTVYINGNYYGLLELREDFSKSLVANKIGTKVENIEILESTELMCAEKGGYDVLLEKDLTIEENRKALEEVIDIDAFIEYYAFEMFCNNQDWPTNNFRVYKNKDEENALYKPILYDLDCSFNLYPESNHEAFKSVLDKSIFIKSIIQYDEYRYQLINSLCDLLNYTFTEENIDRIFAETLDLIYSDMTHNAIESPHKWVRFHAEHHTGNFMYLRSEVEMRREKIIDLIKEYIDNDLNEMMTVSIATPNDGDVILYNNNKLFSNEEAVKGTYFKEAPFEISYVLGDGNKFEYWFVNGEKVYSETINTSDYDNLDVQLVTSKIQTACLRIAGYSNDSDNDFVEFVNLGTEEVNLSNYELSDDYEDFDYLPNLVLKPGEKIRIYCKDAGDLGDYYLDFNLKYKEVLTLTLNDEIIDQVEIKDTDGNSNTYLCRYANSPFLSECLIK